MFSVSYVEWLNRKECKAFLLIRYIEEWKQRLKQASLDVQMAFNHAIGFPENLTQIDTPIFGSEMKQKEPLSYIQRHRTCYPGCTTEACGESSVNSVVPVNNSHGI